MDEFSVEPAQRLKSLSVDHERRGHSLRYTKFIRSLRVILPLAAVGMIVIVLTWDEGGRRMEPIRKEELIPASENIQNELIKPVFNSIDESQQPFSVTADRAIQNRENPDLVNLENPKAEIALNDGGTVNADASSGIYQQDSQKLNLSGTVEMHHSDGYILKTEELRVDMVSRKAFSGRDVRVEGKSGTIDATGLEADANAGTMIFTGPAKLVLQSDGALFGQTKEDQTP